MLSIAQIDKKDHATATPTAWSRMLRFPSVEGMPRQPDDDEKAYKIRLGAAIVQMRALRDGMSQATLAELLHRSEPTLSRWETGKSQPSAYDLKELCRVLDCPPELFIDPPDKPISPVALQLAALRASIAVEDGTAPMRASDDDPLETTPLKPVRGPKPRTPRGR